MRSYAVLVVVTSWALGCEPKASPPSAETGGMSADARVAAKSAPRPSGSGPSTTLHRPCKSHAACSDGELCFSDTSCSAGSCQKAIPGCSTRSCACVAPALCRTACVDHGACVTCSLPPPPP